MANDVRLGIASRKAGLDAQFDPANGGTLVVYDGTKPANSDTAVTTQNVLATFTLGNPAFGAAAGAAGANATKTLNAVSAVSASRAGTASWYRMYKSDATTAVHDGTVGTSGCDCNINQTVLSSGDAVSITSCVMTSAV